MGRLGFRLGVDGSVSEVEGKEKGKEDRQNEKGQ